MIVPAVRILLLSALLALPLAAAADEGTRNRDTNEVPKQHNEWTVAQLEAAMAAGTLSSEELTKEYIKRIIGLDQNGPGVNAVIELNPDALDMARNADRLRKHGIVLGPLHGIPVLLKANVDTGDKMQTTAGSFALV
jgi:amidase